MTSYTTIGIIISAIMIFVTIDTIEDYYIVENDGVTAVINGVAKPIRGRDLFILLAICDAPRRLVTAIGALALFYYPIYRLTICAVLYRAYFIYPVVIVLSIVSGGMISIAAWVIVGGWGPPFLLSLVGMGLFLGMSMTIIRRLNTQVIEGAKRDSVEKRGTKPETA
jgi:hypothetical protein